MFYSIDSIGRNNFSLKVSRVNVTNGESVAVLDAHCHWIKIIKSVLKVENILQCKLST